MKNTQYDYPLGSWLWIQKTKQSAPEIALYGHGDEGIGYYLMLENKCYQKEDFCRIWEKALTDPRVPALKNALKKAGDIGRLSLEDARNLERVTCHHCVVECCGWEAVECCFRKQFMKSPRKGK